jgi:hypothetical protein
MRQSFARSLLDIDPGDPFCRTCGDIYYIIVQGKKQVCPDCSCRHCKRLKNAHIDCGGCICANRNGNGRKRRRVKETNHA